MKIKAVTLVSGMFVLAALLLGAMPQGAAAQSVTSDRGGVSIRVIEPYGWAAAPAHLLIYPVGGGSFLISRYTGFSGVYVGRLHAGRYLVNAHGFGGGFGSGEFVVVPGETSTLDVALIGTAFTRLHYRHHLGLLHAEHHLLRDRVMLAVHQHRAMARTFGGEPTRTLRSGNFDEPTTPTGRRSPIGGVVGATAATGGDEWEHLARTAEQPAMNLPHPIAHGSAVPGGFTPMPSGPAATAGRAGGAPQLPSHVMN